MSRILDAVLEPSVTYTGNTVIVRVKVQDDYKYKKYIVSENIHYKTVQGTSFTLTDAQANKQASITGIKGAGEKRKIPFEYQEVEYIESTGTQYIDTGFKPDQDTRVEMEIIPTADAVYFFFGARSNLSPDNYAFLNVNSNFRSDYGGVGGTISRTRNEKYYIDKDKKVTTVKRLSTGTTETLTSTDKTITPNINAYLFSVHNSGSTLQSAFCKLYWCKLYDNGTLVRNYIPCYRKSDNVIGMYDLVTNTFKTHIGTGTFIKGADVLYNNVTGDNNVVVSNKNLFDKTTVTNGYYLNESGGLTSNANYCVSAFIPVNSGETYYLPTRRYK